MGPGAEGPVGPASYFLIFGVLSLQGLQEDWHSQSQPGNKHKTLSYAYCLGLCRSLQSSQAISYANCLGQHMTNYQR
jgi:hypothetical protein